MERIVVGIDGSDGSREALAWAVEEAKVHGGRVEAVHVWQMPGLTVSPYGIADLENGETYQTEATKLLDDVVDSTYTVGLDTPVEKIVMQGQPAPALVETATGADMLVVGSRGLGGFRGLLLGSVSSQVVHHAHCPVVVLRPRD